MTHGRKVLITEGAGGASRAALSATRMLGKTGYQPIVTVSERLSTSYAAKSRYATHTVRVPIVRDDRDGYIAAIKELSAEHDFLTILPVSDAALIALRPGLEPLVAKDPMMKTASAVGFTTPPTRAYTGYDSLFAASKSFDYPVIVKPSIKSAAARLIGAGNGLDDVSRDENITWLVQPFLQEEMHGVAGVAWNGGLLGTTHLRYRRLWPLPTGTVASACTVEPDLELEEKILALLGNYSGPFHVDMAGDNLLDLNLRFHATLPVAAAAGANLIDLYMRALGGDPNLETIRARAGVLFRWLEADVRSAMVAFRANEMSFWAMAKAIAPRRGTVHSLWSADDLRPLTGRAFQLVERLRAGRDSN